MKKILLLSLSCSMMGCTVSELDRALDSLDAETQKMDFYAEEAESRAHALKASLHEVRSDSVGWETAHAIVDIYRHLDLDSMSRYVNLEKKYASDRHQEAMSMFDDIYEMAYRGNDRRAAAEYSSIGWKGLSDDDYTEYLCLGLEIFKHDKNSSALLEGLRRELFERDTVSYTGVKNHARYHRKAGDYEGAMAIFKRYREANPDSRHEPSILYNMATLYGMQGDRYSQKLYYAKSAIADIRRMYRDSQSLYRLSLMLLEEKDYERADRYMALNYNMISKGYYYPRLSMSGSAYNRITAEYNKTQKAMRWSLGIGMLAILLLSLLFFRLFISSRRKSVALQRTNEELLLTGKKLAITNRIKENYVSRYMMLARKYLGEVSEQRLEFKRIYQDNGPDSLYKRLKQVDDEYNAEKEFYHIFDEAFLGIYPDFVHQVNSLIAPGSAYDEGSRTLPTEIRILALMRLGISSSRDIAAFLNCSINTVYTYRVRIRNLSLVGKDALERVIAGVEA